MNRSVMSAREDENRRLLRARDAIDRYHARRLDVDELARIAVMSSAHFSRRFSALFGETPHRYLQRRRIERACAALRSGRTVTDTAFAVGYDSVGTFSRTFTAIVGCTPTAYRRAAAPIPVPGCVVRDWTRPATGLRSFGEALTGVEPVASSS
ncbi:helix-turn-helix transcriptional regulator [Gordonia polyisoprenivorans]|uniref:helix-turn-helix domain-containing protein n=1 Tax=Gordonia polyisoprenivorans TaxID=84595 RepID=UPI001B8D13C2|nr:AraC family transcriptional regulator [Gordonia polyisoprenivorans]QUD81632.1 helix-turn-helix transcriptional regulator [Gordonia polyisoprenivorans]UZF57603.1 AraC family transcriptional regulator [Gordonia polyisoprenivorans]